jgi:peroxiredoxin
MISKLQISLLTFTSVLISGCCSSQPNEEAQLQNSATTSMASSETATSDPATPEVGSVAPDFELKTLGGESFSLRQAVENQETLLVVLRGYPGYQCPICSRQVADFIVHQEEFKEENVQVVMVYPGPVEGLEELAEEFLANKNWPENYIFLLDPDYTMLTLYNLRWDAPRETSYPSTFHIMPGGKIAHLEISQGHGGRVDAETALAWVK